MAGKVASQRLRSRLRLLEHRPAITGKKAGFKSLGDTWADTTTSHGRLMLTVLQSTSEQSRGFRTRCR
jgi:hypothetical protein